MRILAIDPGTSCGWALFDNGNLSFVVTIKMGEQENCSFNRLTEMLNDECDYHIRITERSHE